MFRKKGKNFPNAAVADEIAYATTIAGALRTELGRSHRATKTLMRWTGASDRTAKNWLSGSYGPSGPHLIRLTRESDTVLATVLGLAGRNRHLIGAELIQIRTALSAAMQLVDTLLEPSASVDA
jgi:hypothetical protein